MGISWEEEAFDFKNDLYGRRKIGRLKWCSCSERVFIPVKLHYLTEHLRHTRRHYVGRPPDFEGACLDIGSFRSLIGLSQARPYFRAL